MPRVRVRPARFMLVVDDDAPIRDSVRELLTLLETPTIAASNGIEAMRAIARVGLPAGVVTDVHMPDLDGIGLIRELRRKRATRFLPILVMSADQDLAGLPDGVVHARKPISLAALESFVRGIDRRGPAQAGHASANDPHRPTVIVNPASDQVFAEFAGMLVDHGVISIRDLERRLRAIYPDATAHARQLDAAPWNVWYVDRNGSAAPERERGEEHSNVEQQ